MFFFPCSIANTSLGEEKANLSAFCTFVRFVLVWFCRFPLPLGVWEGLRFVIVALPGLFFYLCVGYFGVVCGGLVCFDGLICFFYESTFASCTSLIPSHCYSKERRFSLIFKT